MPKISQFPAGGVAQNTDLIPIVRNGGDYTVTGYNLASLASYGQAYVGTFTATAGQTVFTLPASPGSLANLFISVDGAVMVPGSDYTWTTPVTLTFVVGLNVGQTVLYRYTTSVPIGTSLAGGVSGQVQYNNSGVLNGTTIGGDATLVATTGVMKVNSVQASAIVDASLSATSNIGLTNAALVTVAATFNDGTNTISGGYRVFSGNNAASTDDSAYLVGRGLSGSYTSGAHAFRDESTYTSPSGTGLFGYASFDSIPTIGGSVHWNHSHSYQSRIQYTGSGTIDEIAGYTYQLTHNGAGTVTNSVGLRFSDALGAGPVTAQIGLLVDPLTRGTNNFSVVSSGAGVVFVHAGRMQIGAPSSGVAVAVTGGATATAMTVTAGTGQQGIVSTGASGNFAGWFVGAASSAGIVAIQDGNTGTRLYQLRSGGFATGWFDIKDNTSGNSVFQITTNGGTIIPAPAAGMAFTSNGSVSFPAPTTQTATTYTVGQNDYSIIINAAASCTLTMPTPSSYSGRMLIVKTVAAFTVVSGASNVVPLAGGAAGTAILAATAGKFAYLQSDGTNWITMMAN